MARSRSMARIAARVPAPRIADPLQGLRNFVRTSPWLAIAIAVHVIAGALFAVMKLSHDAAEVEGDALITTTISRRQVEAEPPPEPDAPLIDRGAIPEDAEVELTSPDTPDLPVALVPTEVDYTLDIGDPDAMPDAHPGPPDGLPGAPGSTAIGTGGTGHRGTEVSGFSSARLGNFGAPGGTGTGTPYGRPGGPRQIIDTAILDGLLWLARHQDDSGAWSGATCSQNCPEDQPCQPETALEAGLYSTQADVGMTSLALLDFLGAGFTQGSKQFLVDTREGRKIVVGRDIVLPGLKWLVDQQRQDGSFSDAGAFFLYNEALATLALCEAYGLTHNAYWKKPAQKALDFLCRAQKPNPTDKGKLWGWRYQPAQLAREGARGAGELSEADISVTGWMIMALKSGQLAGLEVPQASIDGALDFVRWSTVKGGLVGYLGPDSAGEPIVGEHDEFAYHFGTMSSIGMCARIFMEQDPGDPFLVQGADVLLADLPALGADPAAPQVDYYYWYYGSLALNQLDGPDAPRRTNKYWGPWNQAMNDTILALQDHTPGACSRGGWMRPDRWSYGFGPVYTTAINVLTLEVYYRYANAFGTRKSSAPRAAQVPAGAAELLPGETGGGEQR